VPTGALICLGQPRTLSSVPSLRKWRADATQERLGARKRLSPETQSLCGPPPGRNKGAGKASGTLRLFGRACSLAGDIGRQPSLILSGIAKGEVAAGLRNAALLLLTLCDEAIGKGCRS
jgi:hypothetical protein